MFLQELWQKIVANEAAVNDFFAQKKDNKIFYNSVDLRHSGFKIAPVDVNCFPAGFNNLSEKSQDLASKFANTFLQEKFPDSKKILILSESNTRNIPYLCNVLTILNIVKNAGYEARIASFAAIENSLDIFLGEGKKIIIEKILRKDGKILLEDGFIPDLIISNNDFSSGIDPILEKISQPIIPSVNLGWFKRSKADYFFSYQDIVGKFSKMIDIDPWFISAFCDKAENLNFKNHQGYELVAKKVDDVLLKIRQKYDEYGVKEEPYCFVKADAGTYGMAIMTVKSGEEILQINKKNRNKMNITKGGVVNDRVIIQEGIVTKDLVKNQIAEPMIYLVASQVVGNLVRINDARDEKISLNSGTMTFADLDILSDSDVTLGLEKEKLVKIYEVMAKLAVLS